ncbi:MAG: hypothetical protein U0900_18315 [Myxococcota bacterium]
MEFATIRRARRAIAPTPAIALLLALATGAALLASCAHDAGPPSWIEHPGRRWPEPRYVTGVGQGADPDAAESAARAAVARKTKGEQEGVEIARTWVAKSPRVHWALAVLDRPALIARLGDRIAEIDPQRAAAAESAKAEPPEKAIVTLLGVLDLTRQREALRTRIARLEGSPPPADAPPSREALEAQLAGVKHALPIEVEAYEMDPESGELGAPLDPVRRALARQVLAKGFPLPADGEWGDTAASWLRVRARIGFERLELGGREGFAAVAWEAALEVLDPNAGGAVVALLEQEARATHINEKTARRLAREEAITFVTEALARWLDEQYAPKP